MTSPSFTFKHLDHVVLRTRQLSRLVDFYRGLGCTVERDRVKEMGMMQLRIGASMLDIVSITDGGDSSNPAGHNLDHFAVRVEPFDEAEILAYCQERNIPAQAMPVPILGADGLGPAIYIEDPDGNRMELKGPPVDG